MPTIRTAQARRVLLPLTGVVAGVLLAGCQLSVQTHSLDGRPLRPPPLAIEVEVKREHELAAARDALKADPNDPEAIIWLGRRLAYLGRYRQAVDLYTDGILRFPQNHRFYRHRGHRWITLRNFDLAIADLERATELIRGVPDEVEPDGLPNARNIPTGTSHFNIWYHLGLAYYLAQDFENAARCYRSCLEFSRNPDALCATSHWLYMTLRRQGQTEQARAILTPISADMEVIENVAYHELLLLYRGEKTTSELLAVAAAGEDSGYATAAYGVGNWFRVNGERDRAKAIFERITRGSAWPSFGHVAAEADLFHWDTAP